MELLTLKYITFQIIVRVWKGHIGFLLMKYFINHKVYKNTKSNVQI